MRKQKGRTFAFVTFNSMEDRNEGIKIMETIQVENRHLVCKDVSILCIYYILGKYAKEAFNKEKSGRPF